MTVSSAGKKVYEASGVNKVLFIKNLVEYSHDFARTVAQDEFWYLDTDNTTVTADAATNKGARGTLLNEGKTVRTVIPPQSLFFLRGAFGQAFAPNAAAL